MMIDCVEDDALYPYTLQEPVRPSAMWRDVVGAHTALETSSAGKWMSSGVELDCYCDAWRDMSSLPVKLADCGASIIICKRTGALDYELERSLASNSGMIPVFSQMAEQMDTNVKQMAE